MQGSITASNSQTPNRETMRAHPYLVLAMCYERPLVSAQRFALEGIHDVVIGRSSESERGRTIEHGRIALRVGVADPRMSSQHAMLSREGTSWTVADTGSRNGTFVNGNRVERHVLEDGDWIELGRTVFVFRTTAAAAPDLAYDALSELPAAMRTLNACLAAELELIRRAAGSDVAIMISGETGTGKEVLARAVHALSGRRGQCVAVNCGAIHRTLVEPELFGYRKGAFSGATEDRLGLIRASDGGTLFLDEVAELPLETQVALLRVLQEGEVTPVGATAPVRVDLRVVTATHRDLEQMVREGTFREDLYSRLCGRDIALPPLRERTEDLGSLIASFLHATDPVRVPVFLRDAGRALFAYDWPRNVRELRTSIESALSVLDGDRLGLELFPRKIREDAEPAADEVGAEQSIRDALRRSGGQVVAAAKALGKSRGHVYRLMQRYGIDAQDYRT